ncbi:TetR family transcriptional regulator [Nocardia sp. NPDC101769]|uniref:TetR/AcrR family transcriptional regulator n=1 Tax=Nocardia sp. NPDC101769 TaxID=3364333 RepID=UPI003830E806
MPEQPRSAKGERTRARIVDAARRTFAEVGFERATVRAIAAAAEVDKSSVIQYFGSKLQLFREVVHWEIPFDRILSNDPAATASNQIRGILESWAAQPDGPMAVLLRASMTSEEAAEILRTHITVQAVDKLAADIDAPDARLRAALVQAILMGIASQRYLLRMPDLHAADIDDIVALTTPLLRELIAPADPDTEHPG